MSHHTLYGAKCLQDYAAIFKITRDDVADSALRRNMGDKRQCEFQNKKSIHAGLRGDAFFGNKNDDVHEHVEQVLDIVSLFNIPGISHDVVMLHVFPITLTGAAKRWVDRLPPGTVDSYDLLKKAFIQRYCPPSRTAKQLEEIRNFKQEGDEALYQAWEWYNNLLYKYPTYDINNHQKVNIFYNGLGAMNRQLLNSQGSIPGMTPVQALMAIQTMADHSQKWHDGSSNRNIESSSNFEGIAAIVSILQNLGQNMKKLNENVHAIQVGCQTCEGAQLDKDCPLNMEVKGIRRFFDNEEKETNDLGMAEAVAALEATLKKKREEPKKVKRNDENLKEIDYDLFLYDSESCEFNRLLCIYPNTFSYEIDIKESYEEIVYKITNEENEKYSEPQEKRKHCCKAILQEKENGSQYWASCNPSSNICDGGDLPINVEKHYWKSNNDSKREELEWGNLRERFGDEEDDLDENLEDLEECKEDKANTILGVIHDKLNNGWFNNTSKDEDDLEGIIDYLKLRSYDGFVDLDDEAYNKRMCRLLGMTYEEPTPILIMKAKVTRYAVGPGETYTKVKVLGVEKIPRTRDNVAAMRAGLMKKIAQEGNNQANM
nr:hypothetical protein [Tanacetum cinerariifolium]